jgi:tRNA (uracil-5-)-methyltransferase TRM9
VHSKTSQRLLALNHQFYTDFGRDFSATRGRLQPGVLRILESLQPSGTILDLGCGNGELARTLSRRGWGGAYLGLDFSLPLLNEAEREGFSFPAQFLQVDLAAPDWSGAFAPGSGSTGRPAPQLIQVTRQSPLLSEVTVRDSNSAALPLERPDIGRGGHFDTVFCFALLHHIPASELRLSLLRKVHELLKPGGCLFLSNWQFLNSPRWKARIQPWDMIGLKPIDLDANDYLLDWRRGGTGLRYVHYFDFTELETLAKAAGFEIIETFYSDGENKRMSIYQTWQKTENQC